MPQEPKSIGLAEFLAQLRSEIDNSQRRLRLSKTTPLFNLKEAEVEVSFGATREGEGKGGVELYVFTLEAARKYGAEQIHKLTLKLEPIGELSVAGDE